ncbi:hypothetical protein HYH03_006669 [Edaphochlamys debaryana]|uniref:Protein ENHANCED DISEASE RESISTANCE 2 C-terminal domain-containing protein n=1 Tax=Edaphochlamys debaryana TaxID=47281 RepID=A0A836C0Z5_9CHLO|nr:hypothetical protein HYH03_006669 [Edaphochlamys debaryana]|eukprot:KAG2495058.1 hypothetical protein HYH03_006669 [Edaphochlamys debaryana]
MSSSMERHPEPTPATNGHGAHEEAHAAAHLEPSDGAHGTCSPYNSAGGLAAAAAAVAPRSGPGPEHSAGIGDEDEFVDGRDSMQLQGTSEASEDTNLGQMGGPISKLTGCLSLLTANVNIRIPGTAGPASGSGGPLGSPTHTHVAAASTPGPATAAPGSGRRSRRLVGKMEPGSSLHRWAHEASILDAREAWGEVDHATATASTSAVDPAAPPAAGPAGSMLGRPFVIRGPDYMRTKIKIPSKPALYRLLAADVVTTDTKVTHLARHINIATLQRMAASAGVGPGAGGTGDPHIPPLLIINIMLPMVPPTFFGSADGTSQNLVYYYALPPDFDTGSNQKAVGLLKRFVTNGREADGTPTRDRLKFIPRVVNVDEWSRVGPLSQTETKLLQTYNDKPVLTRPQHYFYTGPGYLEVDIDIHLYQFLARKAFSAYFSRLPTVIYENAFVIQGNTPDELPEQVLAAVRIYRVDFARARPLRDFLTPPGAGTAQRLTAALGSGGHTAGSEDGDHCSNSSVTGP